MIFLHILLNLEGRALRLELKNVIFFTNENCLESRKDEKTIIMIA